MFAAVRAQLGIRKTKARGRRGKFPVTVTVRGERQRASTPIDHHPTMLHLVSFAPPGILSHQPPSKDFTDTRWWAWRLGDERAFREKLDEIRLTTRAEEIHLEGVFLAQPFGRYLAKIAHCTAIMAFGPDSFTPMLPPIILKEGGSVSYLVGAEAAGTSAKSDAPHHWIELCCMRDHSTGHTLLACSIRLYAWLTTPTYLVIDRRGAGIRDSAAANRSFRMKHG